VRRQIPVQTFRTDEKVLWSPVVEYKGLPLAGLPGGPPDFFEQLHLRTALHRARRVLHLHPQDTR
jgi:hypothetical protein